MNVIQVLEQRRISSIVELKDRFELRPEKGWVWLQRLCFRALARIGAFAELETTKIKLHDVGRDGERFMTRVLRSRQAVQGSFEREPTQLLIGPKEYAELMEEILSAAEFSFDAQYYRRINGVDQVYGLKVRMVPWMRGILLL